MTRLTSHIDDTAFADALEVLRRLAESHGETEHDDGELDRGREALRQLPSVFFHILSLLIIRGMNPAEIAGKCGCSEARVLRWLEHAREALGVQLQVVEATATARSGRRSSRTRPPITEGDLFEISAFRENTAASELAVPSSQSTQAITHTPHL